MKKFSSDYSFPTTTKRVGKCYGNQVGLAFSMKSLEFNSSTTKKEIQRKMKAENKGTDAEHAKCLELAEEFRCSRKKLLIREATCKESPFSTEMVKVQ